MNAQRFMRLPDVENAVGLKRERIRQLEAQGQFPERIQLVPGGRAIAWLESEINEWIAERVRASRPDMKGEAA